MREYRGPIRAVIFDWAGTTVDHGSLAPVRVLQEIFSRRGVTISDDEARRDMGIPKKNHIGKVLYLPDVSKRWTDARGHSPTEADVESLYADFVVLQTERLVGDSPVIDGVAEVTNKLRRRGIKIGSTTGYTRAMLDLLLGPAAAHGYRPDCSITPDEVGGGRPFPWMIFANAIRLQVEPLEAIVKIGDTVVDIEEGLRAGVWTIGVARTGNLVGLSAEDFRALSPEEQTTRIKRARSTLQTAGAHQVVDAVADVETAIAAIEGRVQTGERP